MDSEPDPSGDASRGTAVDVFPVVLEPVLDKGLGDLDSQDLRVLGPIVRGVFLEEKVDFIEGLFFPLELPFDVGEPGRLLVQAVA